MNRSQLAEQCAQEWNELAAKIRSYLDMPKVNAETELQKFIDIYNEGEEMKLTIEDVKVYLVFR
jgi:hypothetical protein